MMPTPMKEQAPVPPPAYHRVQGKLGPALHIDALTLVSEHMAFPHALPSGGTPGSSPMFSTSSRRLWRSASHVPRRIVVAHRALAHTVASFLSRYARLVARLTRSGPGMRLTVGQGWPPSRPVCLPTMEARKSRWSAAAGNVVCPDCPYCATPSAHECP